MAALADAAFSPRRAALHYAAMAREWVRALRDSESPIPVKRYFYALRPALAIRSMRLNPGSRPPMHLHALLQSAAIAPDLARTIDELVAAKAHTREMGNAARIPAIDALVLSEWDSVTGMKPEPISEGLVRRCDDFFRAALCA